MSVDSRTGLNVKHDAGVEVVSCSGDETIPVVDRSALPGVLLSLLLGRALLTAGATDNGAGAMEGVLQLKVEEQEA